MSGFFLSCEALTVFQRIYPIKGLALYFSAIKTNLETYC